MKLGTENKKKTIAAVVLLALAAVMIGRNLFGGGVDNSPPPQAATTTAASGGVTATPTPTNTTTSTAKPRHASGPAGKQPPHPVLAQTLDPTLRFDLLKSSEDVHYDGRGRNIFRNQAPPPAIPDPVTSPMKADNTPPPPPPPPPIDLKFYGFASRKDGDGKKIFLSHGEDIFVAKEGDIVNRRYKIMRVSPNSVEVQDVLTNNTQTIPLSAG